jgi:hypothetical protein
MHRSRAVTVLAIPLVAGLVAGACSAAPPEARSVSDGGFDPRDASLEDVRWDHVRVSYDGAPTAGPPRVPVKAELVAARTDTAELLFAAGEMQISGEPFAEGFAGRNLNAYDRNFVPTDQYLLATSTDVPTPVTDLFGFSTAVESYEYSKYHMNMVAQQTTAGLSLAVGPLVAARAEGTPVERMRAREAELIVAAGTDVGGYVVLPAPTDNPLNPLGFEGLWPTFAPFKSFDAAMAPHDQPVQACTFAGGYGGPTGIGITTPEYECAYTSLHLLDREAQVEKVLTPRVLGLATWKEALWSIDFAGRIHDAAGNRVTRVADADRVLVGAFSNLVRATQPPTAARGTYLGSTPLEGMWGLTMLAEMDSAAEFLTRSLSTADGTTLGGFPSKLVAAGYDYDSPLRWFPAAVTVKEDGAVPYPGIAAMTISDPASRSEDLAALLIGHAMLFGMTDARNAAVGQLLGLQLTFDGNPFPADDPAIGGEETTHDRALAVMRVAFVDLDRVHTDPKLGITLDTATIANSKVTRGAGVSTTALAHVIIALRQTLLALNGAITQYGAADPDPEADASGALNSPPIHPPGGSSPPTFSRRVRTLIESNAAFVRDALTQEDGSVSNGATVTGSVPAASRTATTLESQSAAIRALVEGFLVTGDESYRARARAVARRMSSAFYSAPARMFRGIAGGPDDVLMTAAGFAWLQSALRETHKVLHLTGDSALGRDVLEDRIARVNKLYLNGWDDLDGDETPGGGECLGARMQLGEQALTGELGTDNLGRVTSDRDRDCVPEIDDAKVGSVMAGAVRFHSP